MTGMSGWGRLSLLLVFLLPGRLAAGDDEAAKPEPFGQYLLADQAAEVDLARSAAPPEVGEKASVWVLGREGYREAVTGSNGFVCLVGRGWSAPIRFVSGRVNGEFWSTAVKAPMCLNPEAVATILPVLLRRTELARQGATLAEVEADAARRFSDGSYLPPRGVAMSFMLSKRQHLGDAVGHFMPHLMLYAPFARNGQWGGFTVGSGRPFVGENQGGPHALVIIPVGQWSDGTPAAH